MPALKWCRSGSPLDSMSYYTGPVSYCLSQTSLKIRHTLNRQPYGIEIISYL
jgi:hypothetical protein